MKNPKPTGPTMAKPRNETREDNWVYGKYEKKKKRNS